MVVIALAAGVRCLDLDFCVKLSKKSFRIWESVLREYHSTFPFLLTA